MNVTNWFETNKKHITEEWFEFLRFPSIGTDPDYLNNCTACSLWLHGKLNELGFSCKNIGDENLPPVVYAERKSNHGNPKTVIIYGHYDVQPPDPLELWETAPWEPHIRNDRVYARGAQDNKGHVFFQIQAIKYCIQHNIQLPDIKFVVDGQEESGSKVLFEILESTPQLFKADVLMVADTMMMEDKRPAIVAGLRGVTCISFKLEGADHDLHSGLFGGTAPNSAEALAEILATLHNPDGTIAVEGFMDGMLPPADDEIKIITSEPFDEAEYVNETGIPPIGGNQNLPVKVREALYPTIEINGLHSGYNGPGHKTVIPAAAEVKISMRTCPGQTPAKCLESIETHFRKHLKKGMKLSVTYKEPGAEAVRVSLDSGAIKTATRILNGMDKRGCVITWCGASIHIVGELAKVAGAEPVLAGFGLRCDRIHSPNESFSFEQAAMTLHYTASMLKEIGSSNG